MSYNSRVWPWTDWYRFHMTTEKPSSRSSGHRGTLAHSSSLNHRHRRGGRAWGISLKFLRLDLLVSMFKQGEHNSAAGELGWWKRTEAAAMMWCRTNDSTNMSASWVMGVCGGTWGKSSWKRTVLWYRTDAVIISHTICKAYVKSSKTVGRGACDYAVRLYVTFWDWTKHVPAWITEALQRNFSSSDCNSPVRCRTSRDLLRLMWREVVNPKMIYLQFSHNKGADAPAFPHSTAITGNCVRVRGNESIKGERR